MKLLLALLWFLSLGWAGWASHAAAQDADPSMEASWRDGRFAEAARRAREERARSGEPVPWDVYASAAALELPADDVLQLDRDSLRRELQEVRAIQDQRLAGYVLDAIGGLFVTAGAAVMLGGLMQPRSSGGWGLPDLDSSRVVLTFTGLSLLAVGGLLAFFELGVHVDATFRWARWADGIRAGPG